MSSPRLLVVFLVASALLLAGPGCGGKAAKRRAKKPAAADKVPAVDPDSAVTVDEGRLSVSSPKGWARGPRSKEYLVRYMASPQKTYPSITVTAADTPAGLSEVTAANQADFVAAVSASLAEAFAQPGAGKLTRQPSPVTLGRHAGVSYAASGRVKSGGIDESIDRDCLALVVNGRLVTVEARALRGKLEDARSAAEAVATAIAPPQPAAPPAAFAPTAPPAGGASTPAEPELDDAAR